MSDDLALLTGPDAGELLAAPLGTEGGELVGWPAHAVTVRPREGTTVSYRVEARYGDAERTVWTGASTRAVPNGSPALLLGDGARTVAAWVWPRDPWLPGLPAARRPRAWPRAVPRARPRGVACADPEAARPRGERRGRRMTGDRSAWGHRDVGAGRARVPA